MTFSPSLGLILSFEGNMKSFFIYQAVHVDGFTFPQAVAPVLCLSLLYIGFWKFTGGDVPLRTEIVFDYELERKSNQLFER
jgi:hypothetical protein